MGRAFNTAVNLAMMCLAIGIAYEAGKEKGARDMFFKWTEAYLELKEKEKLDELKD